LLPAPALEGIVDPDPHREVYREDVEPVGLLRPGTCRSADGYRVEVRL
jgi:hypothetical protein